MEFFEGLLVEGIGLLGRSLHFGKFTEISSPVIESLVLIGLDGGGFLEFFEGLLVEGIGLRRRSLHFGKFTEIISPVEESLVHLGLDGDGFLVFFEGLLVEGICLLGRCFQDGESPEYGSLEVEEPPVIFWFKSKFFGSREDI